MPKITVLPHPEACPEGAAFEAETGANLARALIAHGVKVQHACEFNCACATCHVIVREGFDSLAEPSDNELDHLDTAWGACQLCGSADAFLCAPARNDCFAPGFLGRSGKVD